MVFRGHGKGAGSDESRNPTAKFITKNRGTQSNKQSISAQNSTGTGLYTSLVPTMVLQDPNSGPRVPEDLQVKLMSQTPHKSIIFQTNYVYRKNFDAFTLNWKT